jgi:hypothetical protein
MKKTRATYDGTFPSGANYKKIGISEAGSYYPTDPQEAEEARQIGRMASLVYLVNESRASRDILDLLTEEKR